MEGIRIENIQDCEIWSMYIIYLYEISLCNTVHTYYTVQVEHIQCGVCYRLKICSNGLNWLINRITFLRLLYLSLWSFLDIGEIVDRVDVGIFPTSSSTYFLQSFALDLSFMPHL